MANTRPDHDPSITWPLLILIGATVLAFLPVISADFVAWDDTHNLVKNERMNPPSAAGAAWYWTHTFGDLYIPLTYTVWSAAAAIARTSGERGIAELNPYLFHALNLLLHLAAASVVFLILRRLTRAIWPACAGALLFAMHPVQVESVAWVSGLKDVLAGLLCLCALLTYLHSVAPSSPVAPSPRRPIILFVLATLLFLLALLSKPSAVVLPLIVAAVDLVILRRQARRVIVPVGLWLLLCIPFIVIARKAQPAASLEFIAPLWSRPLVALDALGFYVMKLIAPIHLAIDYGRSPKWLLSSPQLVFAWIIPAAVAALAIIFRRRFPALAAGAVIFAIAPLPVLGFVPFDFQGYSTTADHYLYLAMLGPAVILAWALTPSAAKTVAKRIPSCAIRGADGGASPTLCSPGARRFSPAATMRIAVPACILLALAIRTYFQAFTWQSSEDLFAHTLTVNPDSLAGNVNLGQVYANQANAAARQNLKPEALAASNRAVALLTRALKMAPNDPQAHHNLANAQFIQGRFDEAIAHYRAALERDPHNADIQNALAAAVALQARRAGQPSP